MKSTLFEMDQDQIKCDIEPTHGSAICPKCGQRGVRSFEHGETLTLRHLPICERKVTLYLHTKRYRCQPCSGRTATIERGDWCDTDALSDSRWLSSSRNTHYKVY
jgi:transposase